jgi:hypothetical protein
MPRFPIRPTGIATACLWLLVTACSAGLGPGPTAGAGGWTAARQIPSVAETQLGFVGGDFYSQTGSLSCPSPGNCTLVYPAMGVNPRQHGFADSEVHGIWGRPQPIGIESTFFFVSCTAPGDCLAAATSWPTIQAVVVNQVHGVWGRPKLVPGLAALANGGPSGITAVACSASGWCSVAGSYVPGGPRPSKSRPFVVSERDGTWRKPIPLPGHQQLNNGWYATIAVMSCDPTGNCVAGGSYRTQSLQIQPFVVSEHDGVWASARAIAGVTTAAGSAAILAISCPATGDCTAAGGASNQNAPFVVTERNGAWGRSAVLPTRVSIPRTSPRLAGLSCSVAGQCGITGYYVREYAGTGTVSATFPFVAGEVNGTWQAVWLVPGLAALNRGKVPQATSVSCGAPGTCAAGGYYLAHAVRHPYVVAETDGTWGRAMPVPDLVALTRDWSATDFIRCWPSAGCIAVGDYFAPIGYPRTRIFVTSLR